MKKTILFGMFLAFLFIFPAVLCAETPGGEASGLPEVQTSPVPGEQARHSDDLGQSSTVLAIQVRTYDQLVGAIRRTRVASQSRVEQAARQEKVRECWETGKLIDEHVLQHKERADYGEQVLERLSGDLEISASELRRMLEFARAYPIYAHARKLSWSDYREFLSINNSEERDALVEQAEKGEWTREKIREEVKALTQKEKPVETKAAETLKPSPMGQPGTYKIILAKTGSSEGELGLDLGFSTYFRLSEVAKDLSEFKEGELVSFEENEIQLLGKPRATNIDDLLYTYNARALCVLDGDTIEAVIDLGFGITTTQVLRLRGIDCPELVSKEGKEAKEFVEETLQISGNGEPHKGLAEDARRGTQAGPSILIKASKSDKYDRYLADVFITDKTGESQYLNNLLLEKGYAVKVHD